VTPIILILGAKITPGETTPLQFANGTATTQTPLQATVRGGKIKDVTPDAIYYYSFALLPASGGTITVKESQPSGYPLMTLTKTTGENNLGLFVVNPVTGTPTTVEAGKAAKNHADVNFTVTSAQVTKYGNTFFVGVKYNTKSIDGAPAPTSSTIYKWSTIVTTTAGSSTQATASIVVVDPPATVIAGSVVGPASLANSPQNSGTRLTDSGPSNLPSLPPALSGMALSLGRNGSPKGSLLSAWETIVLGTLGAQSNQRLASLAALDRLFIDLPNHENDLLVTIGVSGHAAARHTETMKSLPDLTDITFPDRFPS
jgi:hypothetical protein